MTDIGWLTDLIVFHSSSEVFDNDNENRKLTKQAEGKQNESRMAAVGTTFDLLWPKSIGTFHDARCCVNFMQMS